MQTTVSSQYKPTLFAVVTCLAVLISISLLAIFSASALKSIQLFDSPYAFLSKQIQAVLVGFALFFVIQAVKLKWIERLTLLYLAASLTLLLLIFVPGLYTNSLGASRWMRLGPISWQPSEFIKLFYVFFLAKYLARPKLDINDLKTGLLPILIILGSISFLLNMQKDLGSVVILWAITAILVFIRGISMKWIAAGSAAFVGFLALLIIREPYRVGRLMSYIDPFSDVKNAGFQITQSFLAFKNGGLFGVGLGNSKQKLFFLPEAHTDFILPVIAEELGLFGSLLITLTYFFIFVIGYRIYKTQINPYKRFLSLALVLLIISQALLNLCVTTGLVPTKGLTLPFVSSGMSSLIANFITIGLLVVVAKESPDLRNAKQ